MSHVVTGSKALTPNPALKPFEALVGKWQTTGSHPLLPGIVLHGHTTFEWLEGGAFLIMHSEIDEREIPDGIAIFGSDDAAKTYFMLYFDERGISRKYDVTVGGHKIEWRRNDADFSQHYVLTIEDGGKKIVGKGKLSKKGAPWEGDLQLTYLRPAK